MVDFRLHFLDRQGVVLSVAALTYTDDRTAIAAVLGNHPNRHAELWQEDRRVRVFDRDIGHAHSRLRAATRSMHQALDGQLALATLTERPAYVRYLQTNRPCCGMEEGLEAAGVGVILPDWDRRRRRAALAHDLTILGMPTGPSAPCPLAADAGSILGRCYVLEGSRLGAQVILQTVETSTDPDVRDATRFLRHGIGQSLWQGFKTVLSQIDDDEVAIVRACSAAEAAFEAFLAGYAAPAA